MLGKKPPKQHSKKMTSHQLGSMEVEVWVCFPEPANHHEIYHMCVFRKM